MSKNEPISHEFLNEEKTHAKNAYGVEFKVGDTVGHDGAEGETAYILHMEVSPTHPPEIMATTTKGTAHLDFLYHPEIVESQYDSVKCSESSDSDSEDSVGSDEGLIKKLLAVVEAVDYDIYKGVYNEDTSEFEPEEVQENIYRLLKIFKKA